MNEQIKDLYDPFNPAVLRLIAHVIAQANKHNISVSLCGEMASDPKATLLLLGMGLREFSMSASSILQVKNLIIKNTSSTAKKIFDEVMQMEDSKTITAYLEETNE
jgi:phosphotransferase system enzyme I (PtsI)